MSTVSTATTITSPDSNPPQGGISTLRATKRKLDDAFQNLDDAVRRSDASQQPPPLKRSNTIRSLYSTLAKYGIKSKEARTSTSDTDVPSTVTSGKSTPHLTAILTRAASRTRKVFRFPGSVSTPAPLLPPTAEYRPSSIPAFLSRLATFKLATYSQKPSAIDAVAAAKCGWTNEGKDRLVCGLCKSSWVVAGREGMSKDAASALVEKQRLSLVQMHKDGCPWKAQQCDPSIYRIPLTTPSAMVRDIKINANILNPSVTNIEVKHPLTATQLNSLRMTVHSFELPSESSHEESQTRTEDGDVFMQSRLAEPLDTAILVSLFGWSIAAPQDSLRRTSLSRATSVAPSVPRTPSFSRASSARLMTPTPGAMQEIPATPSPARRQPFMTPVRVPSTPFSFRMPLNSSPKADNTLLQCVLCQRRIGLWAFTPQPSIEPPPIPISRADVTNTPQEDIVAEPTPSASVGVNAPSSPLALSATPQKPPPRRTTQRQFDLLKEHRSYCPYVVRSTVLPLPPAPQPTAPQTGHVRSSPSITQLDMLSGTNALEGWRAVLTVVLRYGMGQRKRMGLDLSRDESQQEPMEVDGVQAMVEGVKTRGGKDLLRYVKGLLG